MTHYDRLRRKKLGDLLVDEDVATKEAVIAALHEHHQTGTPLGEILIQGDDLTEYDLAKVMVEQYQLPFLDLSHHTYPRELIAKFPARLLHNARMLPLGQFGDAVCFAVPEFPPAKAIGELKKYGAERFYLYAAMAAEIRYALNEHVPLEDDELASDPAAAAKLGAPVADAKMAEDGAWKELFDTANESIVSGLDDDDEQALESIEVVEASGEAENEADDGEEVPAKSPSEEMPDWLGDEG